MEMFFFNNYKKRLLLISMNIDVFAPSKTLTDFVFM